MRIKDPIHGEIKINSKLIIDLIHTKEFQRLRKIKQLGLTNLIFPGAEHTRYIHSLGVFFIIDKILNNFKNENNIFYTEDEKFVILVAGLLHDLGHGPLSHASEVFFNYSHEEYTLKIIKNKKGEIYKILTNIEKYKELNSTFIEQVLKMIEKKHENKALNSLLSSSLDADRMDYLVRDSYYTGSVYGRIDVDRIISTIDYNDEKIVFKEKSIHTLEDFILSRYHMFVQVYLNEKSLVYEKIIEKILNRVFNLYSQQFEFKTNISILLILMEEKIDIEEYLKINDYNFLDVITNFQEENDEQLQSLVTIFEKLNNFSKIDENYEIQQDEILIEIRKFTKKVYTNKEPIYIKKVNGEITEIENLSPIFDFSKNRLEISFENMKFAVSKNE